MILRALRSTGLALSLPTLLASSLACQEPPALLATSQYLFVVRGDWVFQYDVDTLLLKARAPIPDAGSTPASGGRATGGKAPAGRRRRAATPPQAPQLPGLGKDSPPREKKPRKEMPFPKVGRPWGKAIQSGLTWLAKHQDDNGRWDADGFMKHDKQGTACDGAGSAVHDVGVTGLAMLAMLGDGSSLRSGPYKDHLVRATRWLKSQQGDNGRFGSNASHDFIYDHAIATYAMSEAYGLSKMEPLKPIAQRGINYLESHRNPYSVWRYQPRDNDNDISVTSWCLLACKSGKDFGLQVNNNALMLGATYLDQVSGPDGKHGYTKPAEGSSRMPGDHATRFPIERGEALTAAGLFCRFFLGQDPKQKPVMKAAARRLLKKLPKWDVKAGSIDHYYWYYGTYAIFQMGGNAWKTWSKHINKALLPNQDQEGNSAGSWAPKGVWGQQGGRVYSTALSVLALEASFRYSRLVR